MTAGIKPLNLSKSRFILSAAARTDRTDKKARRYCSGRPFVSIYEFNLCQDPPHTDRPMMMVMMPGGGFNCHKSPV